MKEKFFSAWNTVKNALSSSANGVILKSTGLGAALGGFVLSVPIYFKKTLTLPAQIYTASFAPFVTVIAVNINEFIKLRYFQSKHFQINADKNALAAGIENLKKLKKKHLIEKRHPDTYQEILATLEMTGDNTKEIEVNSCIKSIEEAIEHNLAGEKNSEKFLKCATYTFDISISLIAGMSTVFINFIIPRVLTNENNPDIDHSCVVLAVLFALYAGISTVCMSEKAWAALDKGKMDTSKLINEYGILYQALDAEEQKMINKAVPSLLGFLKEAKKESHVVDSSVQDLSQDNRLKMVV